MASGWNLIPKNITCDFEKGLINTAGEQFKGCEINGCLFHWKQALRRKMMSLNTSCEHISMVMTKNVIDVLTVIPCDEIMRIIIQYIRSILDMECNNNGEHTKMNFLLDSFYSLLVIIGYFHRNME